MQKKKKVKNILIVGYGSAGKRYHRIIKKYFFLNKLKIFSLNKKNKKKIFIKKLSEIKNFNPQLAIICTPATKRIKIIKFLIDLKTNLLIEKPLAFNYVEAKKISKYINKSKLIVKVGYNLRFLNSLKTLNSLIKSKILGKIYFVDIFAGQNLLNWRKKKDYKNTVSAQKKLGGGVLLELSHEIDYVNWIFGYFDRIFCKNSKISDLKIDVEDNAKILLFSKNKYTINVNLDFCRQDPIRICHVVGKNGSLIWNGVKNKLLYFSNKKKNWKNIRFKKNNIQNSYLQQLKEIIKLCNSRKNINNDLADINSALKTMKLIDSARNSSNFLKVIRIK